jgi:hypothetical protein
MAEPVKPTITRAKRIWMKRSPQRYVFVWYAGVALGFGLGVMVVVVESMLMI